MSFSDSRTWKAAVLSSGQFLVTLNGIVLAAVLARLFSKRDYAAYQQTLLTYNVAAPLLTLGLPNALYYFIPRDRSKARSILSGNLLLLVLAGGLFTAAMWSGGSRIISQRFNNAAVRDLLTLYAPYAMLALPVSAAGTCLLSCGRAGVSAIFNVAARTLAVACVVGFVLIWRAPRAAIGGTVVAEVVVFAVALFLMYRVVPGDRWRPQMANILEQVRFSIPLGLASMIGVMSRSVDKVVVSSMCGPEQFAVYVNGAVDIPLIGILTGSINAVLLPEIVELYSRGQAQEALALWRRAAVKCALILLPTMCFLFVMAPEVMRVLFSNAYVASATPFRLYLVLIPIRIVAWGPMLMAAGKSSWILSRTVGSLILNVVLSVVLTRYLGYIGAIVGSICELYLWHTPFYCVAISRLYRCPLWRVVPLRRISLIMVLCLAACVVFLAKPYVPIRSSLLLIGVFGIVYFCVLGVLMVLSGTISAAGIRSAILPSAGGVSSGRVLGQ